MAETEVDPNNRAIVFRGKPQREKTMGKFDAAERNKLPKKDFAEPGKRKFPIPPGDKNHAANAKSRAAQMAKRGLISPAEKAKIDAKASKVLGESAEQD